MSEIKFACPHCRQHIACDGDYVDMCIVCPSCGKPMVVPVLSATDAAHPDLLMVASTPTPRRRIQSRLPVLDPWTEEDWDDHFRHLTGAAPPSIPPWITAIAMALALPLIGLGVLFVGCSACVR